MSTKLSAELLKSLLDYDPETGDLKWKRRDVSMFKSERACNVWNGSHAGKAAGTSIGNHGYREISIFSRNYLAHRLIWIMENGRLPAAIIDHKNQKRLDNRIANLREATRSQNQINSKISSRNKTGLRGVNKAKGKWVANLRKGNLVVYSKTFDCPAAASLAYQVAADKHYGSFVSPLLFKEAA